MSERLAILRVTAEVFVDFCKGGEDRFVRVVKDALPSDAMFVRAGHDVTGTLMIVVKSESFPEVAPGGIIAELPPPTFEVVYR